MRRSAIASIVTFAAISLGLILGCWHPFGDPRVEPRKGRGTLLRGATMPAHARELLIAKCADCHSNETQWPVYARIAPASWLIERDIVEARAKMDLSQWEEIPAEKQEVLMAKIVQEAKTGEMPPRQYLALHWRAALSGSDIASLAMLGKSLGLRETSLTGEGNSARGKTVFEKRCAVCHAMNADREGPRLAGVYGRKAGSVPTFAYSAGLKRSNWTWTEETLDKWLSDPDVLVADNNMSFSVPSAQDRRDLIAYLMQKVTVSKESTLNSQTRRLDLYGH